MLIFLAESDQNLRVGLQLLLLHEPGLHVVGMAVQADGLLSQVKATQPEVLLLDWRLPGASIQDLLADIQGLASPPKIVVLSVNPEDKTAAFASGADGFVSKSEPPDELLEEVRLLQKEIDETS